MNQHQKRLVDTYLDWVNNYYSLSYMAEEYGISVDCLGVMIQEGKELYNQQQEGES